MCSEKPDNESVSSPDRFRQLRAKIPVPLTTDILSDNALAIIASSQKYEYGEERWHDEKVKDQARNPQFMAVRIRGMYTSDSIDK
ncbi:predicted protein [Sclerotinia sclerotiorum 1980 UF-70]|uniref:Uncharacterized protein n=1 Tax=Sclerotinia sclerotiorum (strain ATCC 18683 / 1980 / Ss-1) TaxID=665079 RepID=A7EJB7_SCLS1|nr:predicted protein [Sclerotinia sclerotiorum 1980 UF-70]EDO02933.1 predicted protein [Sclerotinia sclerotiorum 1980 UF-70]